MSDLEVEMISGLKARKGRKILFYQMMDLTDHKRFKDTSPGILHFFAHLENLGHSIDYYLDLHDVLRSIDDSFDAVAISAAEPDIAFLYETPMRIKQKNPHIPIIVGGYCTQDIPNSIVRIPGVDIAIEGEAEYTFPLVLNTMRPYRHKKPIIPAQEYFKVQDIGGFPFQEVSKSPISPRNANEILESSFQRSVDGETIDVRIANVFIRDSHGNLHGRGDRDVRGTVHNPAPLQGELEDLIKLPWWSTYARFTPGLGSDNLSPTGQKAQWKHTRFYARRGCTGSCRFCSIRCKVRTPEPESLLDEIERTVNEYQHQTPARHPLSIDLACDSFTQDRDWFTRFAKGVIERGIHTRFTLSMQHRVDDAFDGYELDTGLMELVRDCNFHQDLGLETLHPGTAEMLGKAKDGERYVSCAKEIIDWSMENSIPTDVFLISLSPGSTLESVCSDYLGLSRLSREAYEKHGRTFGVSANMQLLPVIGSPMTKRMLGLKRYATLTARSASPGKVVSGGIISSFLPLEPNGDGSAQGILKPLQYEFSPEVQRLYDVLHSIVKEDSLFGDGNYPMLHAHEYIKAMAIALYEVGDRGIKTMAEEIAENVDFVCDDMLGKRQRLLDSADQSFNQALYGGSLIYTDGMMLTDPSKWYENITARFEGREIPYPTQLEKVIDVIIGRQPEVFEMFRNTTDSIYRMSFFQRKLDQAMLLLTKFGYTFTHDDTEQRMDQARKAMNEIKHDTVFMDRGTAWKIEMMKDSIREYPYMSKKARDLYNHGFRMEFPSGVAIRDSQGVMHHI